MRAAQGRGGGLAHGRNQTLVGRYQAQEAFPSPAAFARYYGDADRTLMVRETQREMPVEVQREIAAGTSSTKKWDEYLRTYPWQVAFDGPVTLDYYSLTGLNAERFADSPTRDLALYRQFLLRPQPQPVPVKGYFYVRAAHGGRYLVQVRAFDEAETQATFRALQQASPGSPITLLVSLDKPLTRATLTLQNEAKAIPLTKSPVQVFEQE